MKIVMKIVVIVFGSALSANYLVQIGFDVEYLLFLFNRINSMIRNLILYRLNYLVHFVIIYRIIYTNL